MSSNNSDTLLSGDFIFSYISKTIITDPVQRIPDVHAHLNTASLIFTSSTWYKQGKDFFSAY